MNQLLNIHKNVINKEIYPKIIDINFTQLIKPQEEVNNDVSLEQFFELYESKFYEIPIEGELYSHKYMIKKGTEYVGETQNIEEIDLLLEEINQLRLQNIELQKTIDDLTK